MKKKTILYTFIAAAVLAVSFGTVVSLEAGEAGVKKYDFSLTDYNGKKHALSDYGKSNAVAVIWVSSRCPVSIAYNGRMEALYKEFKAKGIAFIGINSNKMEGADEVKEHAHKNGLTFPIVKDPNNVVADRYEASVTPEVYLFSNKWNLLYHGRIDDSRREGSVTSRDFFNVLTAVVSGKPVPVKETKAFGCSIKRVKK